MRILHCYKLFISDNIGGVAEAILRIAGRTPPDSASTVLVCAPVGKGSCAMVDGITVESAATLGEIRSLPIAPN
jgi:hypothetical protein